MVILKTLSDIWMEMGMKEKANYVIILNHFVSSVITWCCSFFAGSTPAASTNLFL